MKVLTMLVLASVLGMSSAVARADVPVVKKAPTAKTQAATTDGAPVKVSQQDKMRLCAKQASGKKGAERKGVHEDLPVDQEGVSAGAPTQASGDYCARRLACAFRTAPAFGDGVER